MSEPSHPPSTPDDGLALRIAALHVHPVKSCAGIAPPSALLIETGLEFDRAWMVVDANGRFVSQRELPRMALVQPRLKSDEMVLRALGMLALHVRLDTVEGPAAVTVWNDRVAAFDMGDLAAQWFTDFLRPNAAEPTAAGIAWPLRMARFDPAQARLADRRWTGAIEAECAFADAFPLLVASTAGLAELNRRLVAAGDAAVTIGRFRPNLVIEAPDGAPELDPHAEDAIDEIVFTSAEGTVRLKLVKPCTRCPIPDVDPATGARGHAVGDVLAGYRADARMGGALTFGMNAVIVEGVECMLAVGMTGRASHRFD
jgi:uncharacterized protein